MMSWENLGEIGNVGQLAGLDAVRLIGMIVKAASRARMHKKNCRQFALHLKLIGNLLEQLKISELKKYPETREPLEQLEDALRRSYILVNSCQDRSYLYLLAMGWNIVYQFRKAQIEIDRYLRIVPLITLVDNSRVKERLEDIERDQCEYTLDEEDRRVQDAILKQERSKKDTMVLKKTLSCSYPNLPFDEALQKENKKLQLELQRSQVHMDVGQCEVIQHLIEVTENAASSLPEKDSPLKSSKEVERKYSDTNDDKGPSYEESYYPGSNTRMTSRNTSSVSSGNDLLSNKGSRRHEEWHSDLLGCCSEPYLCLKTCLYPCGTFSRIATVATDRHMSSAEACNELMAYSLILACCCYTCCIRRKLRKMLNITVGCIKRGVLHGKSAMCRALSFGLLISTGFVYWFSGLIYGISQPLTLDMHRGNNKVDGKGVNFSHWDHNLFWQRYSTFTRYFPFLLGGICDDFLSHLMCCCCALVQEWREVEIRGVYGPEKTKTSPPPSQCMES